MDSLVVSSFLLGISLILLFTEFFLPGGILGGSALVLFMISLIFLAFNSTLKSFLLFLALSAFLIFLVVRLALHLILKTRKENTILSGQDQEGFKASYLDHDLILKGGFALTDLRPSGKVGVSGKLLDATTEGGFIERGTPIEVVATEGVRYIVRRKKS